MAGFRRAFFGDPYHLYGGESTAKLPVVVRHPSLRFTARDWASRLMFPAEPDDGKGAEQAAACLAPQQNRAKPAALTRPSGPRLLLLESPKLGPKKKEAAWQNVPPQPSQKGENGILGSRMRRRRRKPSRQHPATALTAKEESPARQALGGSLAPQVCEMGVESPRVQTLCAALHTSTR